MKKIYLILVIIIFILAIIFSLRFIIGGPEDTWICVDNQWIIHGNPSAPMPTSGCGKMISAISNFEECVKADYPILESYPEQCKTPDGKTFTKNIGNELDKLDLIQVDNPRPNQTISSPLTIEGKARGNWYFEASFPVKLIGEDRSIIASGIATAQDEWMTEEFVPFIANLEFLVSTATKASLILEKDNPSGLEENADELIMPIILLPIKELITVKAFFMNDQLDPEITCVKSFPVERQVLKTKGVARAALEELLKGPTEAEKEQGYSTTINSEVKIQKLTIEDGVVRVDFDETLGKDIGGSCWVSAIRTQITETLKQFSTVNEVAISINGRTEDILQP